MDLVIEKLVIEKDRPDHIAKHDVTIEEVFEVLVGDYLILEGKSDRSLLVGKTKNERFITVVIGSRTEANKYGLITARPTKKKEKVAYKKEFLEKKGQK